MPDCQKQPCRNFIHLEARWVLYDFIFDWNSNQKTRWVLYTTLLHKWKWKWKWKWKKAPSYWTTLAGVPTEVYSVCSHLMVILIWYHLEQAHERITIRKWNCNWNWNWLNWIDLRCGYQPLLEKIEIVKSVNVNSDLLNSVQHSHRLELSRGIWQSLWWGFIVETNKPS